MRALKFKGVFACAVATTAVIKCCSFALRTPREALAETQIIPPADNNELKRQLSPTTSYIDTSFPLTKEQLEFYKSEGYLVLKNFFSQKDIAIIRAQLDEILTTYCTPEQQSRTLTVIQPHALSPVIRHYAVSEKKVASVLSQIVGAMNVYNDGSVKVLQSMLFIKPPSFPGQAWHQDELYLPTRDRSLTAIWIPLEDVSVQNGCLWVVPKSHRRGILYPTKPHAKPDEFEYEDESYGFDAKDAIPVEMKAGDVLFFNGYLLHMSLKNRSQTTRKVLTNHYMSQVSLYPYKINVGGTVIYGALQDNRGVIPVAGDDPYAYKGYDNDWRPHVRAMDWQKQHVAKEYLQSPKQKQ